MKGGLGLLTILEICLISKTIVWFSRIISADDLCRQLVFVCLSLSLNLASLICEISTLLDT